MTVVAPERDAAPAGGPRPAPVTRRAPSRGAAVLAVALTALVASLAYVGAVTPFALVLFVVPGVLVGAATAWLLGRAAGRVTTLVVSVGLVLAWAQLVNVASGDANGPAARSTAVAGSFAALAVLLSLTRVPVWFLVPVVGILVSAVMLGAAAEVAPVAVATAAVASVALALTDRVAQATVGRRRERVWILLGLLVVVLAAALAVALQQARTPDAAYTPLPGLVDPSVRPPWDPPVTASPTPTPTPTPTASLSPTPTATSPTTTLSTSPATTLSPTTTLPEAPTLDAVVSQLLVGLWWLLWLALLALVLFRAWVALGWWRFRRRCHAGAPAAQVVGAWMYLRARLRPLGQPLAPSLSPDDLVGVPAEPDAAAEASPADSAAVRDLAALVVPAAFAAHAAPTTPEVAEAWAHADRAVGEARRSAAWYRRLTAWFSPPGRGTRRH